MKQFQMIQIKNKYPIMKDTSFMQSLDDLIKEIVQETYLHFDQNKDKTMKALKIGRSRLLRYLN